MRFLIFIFFIPSFLISQDKSFDIEIHFGPQFSNFAKYEQDLSEVPTGFLSWYDKNQIGTVFGAELSWNIKNGKNTLGILYERQFNSGKQNAQFYTNEGSLVIIRDFRLRNINNFFALQYKRKLNNKWKLLGGFYIINQSQQEIDYWTYLNIDERNVHNSRLQDGGFFLGAEYYFYNSGNFSFGIKSKFYYTISLGDFETFNLTPSLKYNF